MSAGTNALQSVKSILEKQYTTSIPITAGGITLPKYLTIAGVCPPRNSMKGAARRMKEIIAITAMSSRVWGAVTLLGIVLLLSVKDGAQQYERHKDYYHSGNKEVFKAQDIAYNE